MCNVRGAWRPTFCVAKRLPGRPGRHLSRSQPPSLKACTCRLTGPGHLKACTCKLTHTARFLQARGVALTSPSMFRKAKDASHRKGGAECARGQCPNYANAIHLLSQSLCVGYHLSGATSVSSIPRARQRQLRKRGKTRASLQRGFRWPPKRVNCQVLGFKPHPMYL